MHVSIAVRLTITFRTKISMNLYDYLVLWKTSFRNLTSIVKGITDCITRYVYNRVCHGKCF